MNFNLVSNLNTQLIYVTKVLKESIDYYRNRGSHVFACFACFKKVFDIVNCV